MEFLSIILHDIILSHFVNKENFGKPYEDEYELNSVAGREFNLCGQDNSYGWLSGRS
jgi:hypothetical protein